MNNSSQNVLRDDDNGLVFPVVPLVFVLSFISAGALIGNFLVCLAIYLRPALHKTTYLPIASLAMADLLASVTAMPAYILKKALDDHAPLVAEVICNVFRFSYFVTGYASVLSLCVISMERLLAIKKPLTYNTVVTMRRLSLSLLVVWLDAILISSLPFIRWTDGDVECAYSPTRWWSMMVIVSNVLLPFMFITLCYAYMHQIARRHLRMIRSEINIRRSAGTWRHERKASKTVMIVIGVFVISWLPSCFYYFLKLVCPSCFPNSFKPLEGIFNTLVKLLTFSGSFWNPIIYCWRSREFRKAFLHIATGQALCPCLIKQRVRDTSVSFSLRSSAGATQRPPGPADGCVWNLNVDTL